MTDRTAIALLASIAAGDLAPRAAFEGFAHAIEAREEEVQAFAYLTLDAARESFAEREVLPLRGLPVALKDLFDTADMPTAYGSPIYDGYRPKADAAITARLRELGASIVGKTVTTEFATMQGNKTRNPHDLSRTPGGSSSGTAAAIAAGMAPFGIGSQTAGSVIRPAAFCGIAGFKPSWGALPTGGAKPLSASLDTVGVMACTLGDCALLFGLLRGEVFEPPAAGNLRIGVARTSWWGQAEPQAQAAVLWAAQTLAAGGAVVEDVTLPDSFDRLDAAFPKIMTREIALSFGWERAAHADRLSPAFVHLVAEGLAVTPQEHADALGLAVEARADMDALADRFDLLLTPSAPGPAPVGLAFTGAPIFNRMWTALYVPCATLPAKVESPAPVGVQLVGFRNADARFLGHALQAEQVLAG